MDTLLIIRQTKAYLTKALEALAAVNAGMEINPEISRDEAIHRLTGTIERYQRVLSQYNSRVSPSQSLGTIGYAS